jgi:hypothetical protein
MEKQNNFSKELYKLNKVLSQNFDALSKKKRKVYICCYNIKSNEGNNSALYHLKQPKMNRHGEKKYPKFYLVYLLAKFPTSEKDISDMMTFPSVDNKDNSNPLDTAKKYMKNMLNLDSTTYESKGYIENDGELYIFFNIYHKRQLKIIEDSSAQKWFCLIDEICNSGKVLSYPVHTSVTELFYNNPDLIYLKLENKKIQIPVVAYSGMTIYDINYEYAFGSLQRPGPFGPYPFFVDFNSSFRGALWGTTNMTSYNDMKRKEYWSKKATRMDEFGRYNKPGIIMRSALFLGKSTWHIMYQDKDPFIELIKLWDFNLTNLKELEKYHEKTIEARKWAKKYDSITCAPIKLKNIDTVWPLFRPFILRKSSQQIPIGIYYADNKGIPSFWDPELKYNIK